MFITLREGQHLFNAFFEIVLPDKVGDRVFSDSIRSTITKKCKRLIREMKSKSDIWIEEKELYFGPRAAWHKRELTDEEKRNNPFKIVYIEKDSELGAEIEDTGSNKDAIFWMCFFRTHPSSKFVKHAGFIDEIVDPLIEKIGKQRDFDDFIGLTKNEDIVLRDDAAIEAEERKKAEESAKSKKPETVPA